MRTTPILSNVVWENPLEAWEKNPGWKHMPDLHGREVIPVEGVRYNAFTLVKPEDVKVVILGQDPYPKRGDANGLAFSVCPHVKVLPASLRNIFNEYVDDLGFAFPRSGDLTPWAERGVLLLNTALTTIEGKRGAHLKEWEKFTYETIRWLSRLPGRRVFLLWGRRAQQYAEVIGKSEDYLQRKRFTQDIQYFNYPILCSHPSPLAQAHPGKGDTAFKGSKPFSQACEFLDIDKEIWRL